MSEVKFIVEEKTPVDEKPKKFENEFEQNYDEYFECESESLKEENKEKEIVNLDYDQSLDDDLDEDDQNKLKVRLGKWLWAARFYKTSALAIEAVERGKVLYNDQPVSPSTEIEVNSTITIIKSPESILHVKIKGLSTRRRNESGANELCEITEIKVPNLTQKKTKQHNPFRRKKTNIFQQSKTNDNKVSVSHVKNNSFRNKAGYKSNNYSQNQNTSPYKGYKSKPYYENDFEYNTNNDSYNNNNNNNKANHNKKRSSTRFLRGRKKDYLDQQPVNSPSYKENIYREKQNYKSTYNQSNYNSSRFSNYYYDDQN